jgi:signal peptidase
MGLRVNRNRLATIATWTVLSIVVVSFVLLAIGPKIGAYRVSVVLSDSMKPQWQAGDVIISTPERPDQVRVGQVISFNPPIDGRPSVTHRVIEVTTSGTTPVIRTKGDANAAPDEWGSVRLDHGPVYQARRAIPNLGWALAFLHSRNVALATTMFVPMILLLMLLWRIWRPAAHPARARS